MIVSANDNQTYVYAMGTFSNSNSPQKVQPETSIVYSSIHPKFVATIVNGEGVQVYNLNSMATAKSKDELLRKNYNVMPIEKTTRVKRVAISPTGKYLTLYKEKKINLELVKLTLVILQD